MSGWLSGALRRNLALKLISLALAVLLFVIVHKEKHSLTQGVISVTYRLPADRVLMTAPPTRLTVGISGPATRIRRLDFTEMEPLVVDLGEEEEGKYYRFKQDLLDLPRGLKLSFVHPEGFPVRFEPAATRVVDVEVPIQGDPAEHYRVAKISVSPSTVEVRGPHRLVQTLTELPTEPVVLDGAKNSVSREITLAPLPLGVTVSRSAPLVAMVEIEPVMKQITLKAIPVRRAGDKDGARPALRPTPETVSVTIELPETLAGKLSPKEIRATVPDDAEGEVTVKVSGLPADATVKAVEPPAVLVQRSP